MSKELNILGYSIIRNQQVSVNGDIRFESVEPDLKAFLKSAYREMDMKYPKLFKMDSLCKLAMIGAEPIIKLSESVRKEKVGIVFANSASSLETDREHQRSIDDRNNYFPSPAVFVYTLANIMVGEISIRHKLQGENMSFVSTKFDAQLLYQYVQNLFMRNKLEYCLCGWVDVDGEKYESVQFLIGTEKSKNITFDVHTLNEIYNTK